MNTQQSFTYTITSATSDPTGASAEDVTINIGPLKENYEYYYVQCTSFGITASTLVGPRYYYHLVADNLSENGYWCLKLCGCESIFDNNNLVKVCVRIDAYRSSTGCNSPEPGIKKDVIGGAIITLIHIIQPRIAITF